MWSGLLVLLLGVGCAIAGGELFVRGAVGLSQWARVSPAMIAATVAAFATSSPEVAVAISSAWHGNPELTLGDVLGSNVANVALILGLAIAMTSRTAFGVVSRRDTLVALVVPLILAVLLSDGELSRIDALLLIFLFLVWFGALVAAAVQQRRNSGVTSFDGTGSQVLLTCCAGLLLLTAAGVLVVEGASRLALAFGVSEFVIGATLVAVGTSTPELATTLVAKRRGHDDVSLGTIMGSNIFNGLLVAPLAALIHPATLMLAEVTLALVIGVLSLLVVLSARPSGIPRWRGVLLLALFVAYLTGIFAGA